MKNSSLEITEQEYLIKLSREEYNISFIHQLLKRIQNENFFSGLKNFEDTEDLRSRSYPDHELRFDDLREK